MNMNEETIDLSTLWQIVRKKLGLIIVVTILMTMISGIFTFFFVEPEYRSTVSVFISDERTGGRRLLSPEPWQKMSLRIWTLL